MHPALVELLSKRKRLPADAYRAARAVRPQGRRKAVVMRSVFQIIGVLGAALAGVGSNAVLEGDPAKARIGYWLLIPGIIFGAGGLTSIVYLLIHDLRLKLTATIRGARLFVEDEEGAPGSFRFRLVIELIITPPDGQAILFNSDNIKARVDGFVEHPFPIECSNLGISPSTNPRIADGQYTELTVARQTGVICDGVFSLTPGQLGLSFPRELVYDVELMDVNGDWFAVVESKIYRVAEREYAGFPDMDKPAPQRVELQIAEWLPFGIATAIFFGLVLWIGYCLIVRGWL